MLSFLNRYTRMGGTEFINNLLAECKPGDSNEGVCIPKTGNEVGPLMQSLTIALVVKGVLMIVTFGIKVPAGIFIPTLGGMQLLFVA
jgi:chloride channel 3/4/5